MKIVIENIPPYDGEYHLDPFAMTFADRRRIKQVSGLTGVQLMEGILNEDTDLYVALAVVALERGGQAVDEHLLWNTAGGKIQLDWSEDAEREKETDPLGESASDASENGKSGSSGSPSSESSETPGQIPGPIGEPG